MTIPQSGHCPSGALIVSGVETDHFGKVPEAIVFYVEHTAVWLLLMVQRFARPVPNWE